MLLFKNVLMKQLINQAMLFLEHKSEKYQPALRIEDEEGNEEALYFLPAGSYLECD